MYNQMKAFEDYRQNNIMTAPPERLLILLFEALITNISKAKTAINQGDLKVRRESLRKARDIVMELIGSLDFSVGGALALNLQRLYTWVNGRLVQADIKNSAEALDEALRVVHILEEGWRGAVEQVQRERAGGR